MSSFSSSSSWGHAPRSADMRNRRIASLQSDAATKLSINGGTMVGELRAEGGLVTTTIEFVGDASIVTTAAPQVPTGDFLRVIVNDVAYRIQLLEDE